MILLFGQNGQLGRRLSALAAAQKIPCTALSHKECDFSTIERPALEERVASPSVIINAAAWTAVDDAETHTDIATRVNAEVPGWLAAMAKQKNLPFIHFSTDYVFDGLRGAPYDETARTHPLNAYAKSKLAGEEAVLKANPRAYIFRLQWLYDAQGKNFLRSMMKRMGENETLRIVADQLGAPTPAGNAARAVMTALSQIEKGALKPGIYHLTAGGHTSWHGFACAIYEEMRARGMSVATKTIEPIISAEYPLPAERPRDTRLDTGKLAGAGISLPHWRDSLASVMEEIVASR